MSANITVVNSTNFKKEVLESTTPVLVDVWAAWCGPCRMIAPVLEQLAQENVNKVRVAKLNSDENMALSMELGIMSLPTLILFKNGTEATRLIGLMSKPMIQSRIESFL
ncbi:MAG: thioredoxin 1 [Bacillota bacterium]|nr:MAG: thioredoxin 1 [Bacillota bacterium]